MRKTFKTRAKTCICPDVGHVARIANTSGWTKKPDKEPFTDFKHKETLWGDATRRHSEETQFLNIAACVFFGFFESDHAVQIIHIAALKQMSRDVN